MILYHAKHGAVWYASGGTNLSVSLNANADAARTRKIVTVKLMLGPYTLVEEQRVFDRIGKAQAFYNKMIENGARKA